MKVGYIRVNPTGENADELLEKFQTGKQLDRMYWEKISVKEKNRPEYDKMMDYLRAGDELVLAEFARFNKSLLELVKTLEQLNERGIAVISEKEEFNTGTDEGKFKLKVLKSAAEFEKTLTRQRQLEGVAAAIAAGKYKGNHEKETPPDFEDFKNSYYTREMTVADIATHYGVSRPTVYKWIRQTDESDAEENFKEAEVLEMPPIPDDPSIYDEPEIVVEMREEVDAKSKRETQVDKKAKSQKVTKKTEKPRKPRRITKLPDDFEAFRKMYNEEILEISDIMIVYGKSRKTIIRWLKQANEAAELKELQKQERAKKRAEKKAEKLREESEKQVETDKL